MTQSSSPPSDSLERKLQRLAPLGGTSRAFLLVLEGPRAGRLHLLGDQDMLIGRSEDADICLSDASVSTEHARIVRRPAGYYLVDLRSRNGTLLNDVLISERKLRKRDRIQIGETSLVFLEEGASESTLTVALPPHEERAIARQQGIATRHHADVATSTMSFEEENPVFSFVRRLVAFFRLLRRNLWVIVPLPLVGIALGAYSIHLRPPPETATAAVKLTQAPERTPVGYSQPQPTEAFFAEPEKNFARNDLVQETLGELNADPAPSLTAAVRNGLRIERELLGPTGVYVAQFARPSVAAAGVSAVDFLDRYLENYLSSEVDDSIRVLKSQAAFMEKELEDVNKELQQLDDELSDFRRKHIDSLPEQASAVMLSKLDLAQRKAELEIEVERHRIEAANVRSQMRKTDTVVSRRVEDLKPLQDELAQKKRERSRLKAGGLKDDHPDVRALTTQIDMLDSEVKKKLTSGVTDLERTVDPRQQELSRLLQQHEGELRVAESALGKVREQLAGAAGKAAAVPEVDVKIQQLTRRQKSLQSLRDQLFEKHREKRMQIDLETANVRGRYEIVAPAELVDQATTKFLMKRVGAGLLAGLVVALLIIALLEGRRLLKQHPELLTS